MIVFPWVSVELGVHAALVLYGVVDSGAFHLASAPVLLRS